MAKFYFYYSAMNAGKSTTLLQSAFNYQERGMNVEYFTPLPGSQKNPMIFSRIGLKHQATFVSDQFDLYQHIDAILKKKKIACVFVDEAQFLKKKQVIDLGRVVDHLNIPVLAYGLRTDFLGQLFEGSQQLLAIADELVEIKTICFCGKKAVMTARIQNESYVTDGPQIDTGGNEKYVSLCRFHHSQALSAEKQDC
jgi:thymidine kinase